MTEYGSSQWVLFEQRSPTEARVAIDPERAARDSDALFGEIPLEAHQVIEGQIPAGFWVDPDRLLRPLGNIETEHVVLTYDLKQRCVSLTPWEKQWQSEDKALPEGLQYLVVVRPEETRAEQKEVA